MKKILSIFAVGVLSLSAHTVLADGMGSTVTGSLLFGNFPINFFDPAAGSVPARFGNHKSTKVTIGSGVLTEDRLANRNGVHGFRFHLLQRNTQAGEVFVQTNI